MKIFKPLKKMVYFLLWLLLKSLFIITYVIAEVWIFIAVVIYSSSEFLRDFCNMIAKKYKNEDTGDIQTESNNIEEKLIPENFNPMGDAKTDIRKLENLHTEIIKINNIGQDEENEADEIEDDIVMETPLTRVTFENCLEFGDETEMETSTISVDEIIEAEEQIRGVHEPYSAPELTNGILTLDKVQKAVGTISNYNESKKEDKIEAGRVFYHIQQSAMFETLIIELTKKQSIENSIKLFTLTSGDIERHKNHNPDFNIDDYI